MEHSLKRLLGCTWSLLLWHRVQQSPTNSSEKVVLDTTIFELSCHQHACEICVAAHTGTCTFNQTCECNPGFSGPTCSIVPSTVQTTSAPEINVGVVVASGLGGALLTLIIGLIIFFVWKKRVKKKLIAYTTASNTPAPSIITIRPPPLPSLSRLPSAITTPALYEIPLSRRGSAATVTYHPYEETF